MLRIPLMPAILLGVFGVPLTAQVMTIAPPVATATFGQPSILVNTSTTLTFTITNPASNPIPLTGVTLTDTLPGGLQVAPPGGVNGTCSSGTVSAPAFSTMIAISGVSLAAGSTCVLTFNVTANSLGYLTNSFVVSSLEGGSSPTVSTSLFIASQAPPVFSAVFVPSTITQNGTSALTLTIANPGASAYIPGVTIAQSSLPPGLVFATPTNASNSCGGQLIASPGGTLLVLLATPPFAGNSSCVIRVNVTGTIPGTFTYSTFVSGGDGSGNSNVASATLTVIPMTTPGPQNFQEIAVFRNQNGNGLFVLDVNRNYAWDAADKARDFGVPGDTPVAGDWFGTGTINIGVFHCRILAAVCQWQIDANNNGTWDGVAGGDLAWNFGIPGDIPVVGDWTGDGISKIGVMRCRGYDPCLWILDAGNKHVYDTTARLARFGAFGDAPVVNDWAGTGGADQIGIFRNGEWVVDSNGNGTFDAGDAIYLYGAAGDQPIVGNWAGTGKRRIGVFRPVLDPVHPFLGGAVILNLSGNNIWLGPPFDGIGHFGAAGDIPVVGFWTIP